MSNKNKKNKYKHEYNYEFNFNKGYKRGRLRNLANKISGAVILLFIATRIFDIDIWFISDLNVMQLIFLIVAIHFIFKGTHIISRHERDDNNGYTSEEDKWQRWNTYSNDYNQAPPPPPPPNQSFSGYDTYEQQKNENENNEQKNSTYSTDNDQKHNYQYGNYEQRYSDNKYYDDNKQFENNKQYYDRDPIQYNTFIGDFKYEESYTQLRPIMFNAFIGDARIDLSRVEVPLGETLIQMSSFIGDLKVHMPNDPRIGVKINVSSFIGDGKLFEQKRSGFGGNIALQTPNYYECDRKVVIELNAFIGDAKVKRVG